MVTATAEPKPGTKAESKKAQERGPRRVPNFMAAYPPRVISACYQDFRGSKIRRTSHASFDDYAAGWLDSFNNNYAGGRKRKGNVLHQHAEEHMVQNGVSNDGTV